MRHLMNEDIQVVFHCVAAVAASSHALLPGIESTNCRTIGRKTFLLTGPRPSAGALRKAAPSRRNTCIENDLSGRQLSSISLIAQCLACTKTFQHLSVSLSVFCVQLNCFLVILDCLVQVSFGSPGETTIVVRGCGFWVQP